MFLKAKQDRERYEPRFYRFSNTKQDKIDVFKAKTKRNYV